MKAQNNFKPWTLEEVRAVINYPKTWAWTKALSKELGRTPSATAYINTAFNAWCRGDMRYSTPRLSKYFMIITDAKKNAQTTYSAEATMLPMKKEQPMTALQIADHIDKQIEYLTRLFQALGEAIVKEQYAHVNKELKDQKEKIADLEAQLREAKATTKTSIKSLFNLS